MKVTLLLAVFALVPGVFLMQTAGGATVAVMDFDRAIADTPEGKDAISKLNAFSAERRTAIEQALKEADVLQDRLRTQGPTLSETARTQLTQELQKAATNLETMQNDAQTKLGELQQKLLGPVEERTAKVVSSYAAERGLRIVLDSSVLRNGFVYVHDTADITTEIIRRMVADAGTTGPGNALFVPRNDANATNQILRSRWFEADFLRLQPFGPVAKPADAGALSLAE